MVRHHGRAFGGDDTCIHAHRKVAVAVAERERRGTAFLERYKQG